MQAKRTRARRILALAVGGGIVATAMVALPALGATAYTVYPADLGVSDDAFWVADSAGAAKIIKTGVGPAVLELTGSVRYDFDSHRYPEFDAFRAVKEPWRHFFLAGSLSGGSDLPLPTVAAVTANVDPGTTLWVDAVLEYGESADTLRTTVLTCELEDDDEPTTFELSACGALDTSDFTIGWRATETWTTTAPTTPKTFEAGERLKPGQEYGTIQTLAGVGFHVEGDGAAHISRIQVFNADIGFAPEPITVCAEGCVFTTIADGLDAADAGDTVLVGPGIYDGKVTLKTGVTLRGAGNGDDSEVDTIIQGPTDKSGTGITTNKGTADAPVVIENLRVKNFATGISVKSFASLKSVVSTENKSYGIDVKDGTVGLRIADSSFNSNGSSGLKIGTKASASDIKIVDSHFDNNIFGWYSGLPDDVTKIVVPAQLDDVVIERTTFNGNRDKGFYTERLSNAVFTGVTANGSGHGRAGGMGNGISVNLKADDYENIVFNNLTAVGSGGGTSEPYGAAVDISARNDAPSYDGKPGALTGLVINGGTIRGETGEGLIIFGDVSNAAVKNVNLSGNAKALLNKIGDAAGESTDVVITATHNYWGSTSPDFVALIDGKATTEPYWANAKRGQLLPASPTPPPPATIADSTKLSAVISDRPEIVKTETFSTSGAGTDLNRLDSSQPLDGEMPWEKSDEDELVKVYAYSTPVFLGEFPIIDGKVQFSADLAKLSGGNHRLVFIGTTSETMQVVEVTIRTTTSPVVPGKKTVIEPFSAGTTRLAGADRYATAIAMSKKFEPNVPVVFVSTGLEFPDALSASAAAALLGGPLLLTPSGALPSEVIAEITRLNPADIYLVGGTGAVSASVESALSKIATTTRLGGGTRYDTGLAIVNVAYEKSTLAIIATGKTFPDALAASGAAGLKDAPVILVDGSAATLNSATLASLTRLGVTNVVIAGGTAAVSAGIEQQLKGSYSVTRYGGDTRYETAALLNKAYFGPGSSKTAFVATGLDFPDALAGAALAGGLGAPMYITDATCVPKAVHDQITALGASSTVVLGGEGIVSAAAAANTVCVAG